MTNNPAITCSGSKRANKHNIEITVKLKSDLGGGVGSVVSAYTMGRGVRSKCRWEEGWGVTAGGIRGGLVM